MDLWESFVAALPYLTLLIVGGYLGIGIFVIFRGLIHEARNAGQDNSRGVVGLVSVVAFFVCLFYLPAIMAGDPPPGRRRK